MPTKPKRQSATNTKTMALIKNRPAAGGKIIKINQQCPGLQNKRLTSATISYLARPFSFPAGLQLIELLKKKSDKSQKEYRKT